MIKAKIGKKGNILVSVVPSGELKKNISDQDAEMDARATQAVMSAIAKAKFCKKPIAKYDVAERKAYIEYADGSKKYVR